MSDSENECKIKILKDGPYIVSGNIPLSEKIITPKGKGYEYKDGRKYLQTEGYALCRCGQTENAPYCDGTHEIAGFLGTETASRNKYTDRADILVGPDLDLMDDNRCALARFCHREDANAWELTENSGDPKYREEAIKAASDCPSGRLVAIDKAGKAIEPEHEASIEILQDPERGVSGPLFVKGNIPIESFDGYTYELRNRAALCRCGESGNKPFCDATHVPIKFSDK